MEFRSYSPCERLRDIVLCYWSVDVAKNAPAHPERVYSTGGITILFHYGTPFISTAPDGRQTVQDPSLVCGQYTTYSDVLASPGAGMMGVVLFPFALRAFSNIPMKLLTGKEVRFGDLFPDFGDIEERMALAPGNEARVQLLDRTFLALLKSERGRHYESIRSALGMIEGSRALITEESIVDALEVSERTLQRIFDDYIGLTPHEFLQLRRINHAIDSLKGTSRLTDIALDADFYDQAHFIKTFKSITGYTPGEYRKILQSFR